MCVLELTAGSCRPSCRKYGWRRMYICSGSQVRVEHKSAQVTWDSSNHIWMIQWHGVEQDEFDELQLTVYSPNGLRTFIHGSVTGIRGGGSNRFIHFQGPRHECDIDSSLAMILGNVVTCGPQITYSSLMPDQGRHGHRGHHASHSRVDILHEFHML